MHLTTIALMSLTLVALGATAFAQDGAKTETDSSEIFAVIKTDRGDIRLHLFADKAPITVANFVNLAERGYYDGLKFHRVIQGFMIQGGDPEGSGRGGPGYKFADEFHPDLRHSKPGILSMANSGPGTNGSQFFITHGPTPHLDDRHTVFGEVVSGQDVVDAVAQNDVMKEVKIEGDTNALKEKAKEQLTAWNRTLDVRYPKKN